MVTTLVQIVAFQRHEPPYTRTTNETMASITHTLCLDNESDWTFGRTHTKINMYKKIWCRCCLLSFQSFLSCFTADLTLHVWYCIFEPTIFLVWDVSLVLAVASKGSSNRTMFRPQRCNRCMVINAHFVVSTNHQKKYVLQCVLKMSTLLCTPHPNWKWCAHPNWKTMFIKTENDVHIQTENDVHPNWKWCAIILPVDLNYET